MIGLGTWAFELNTPVFKGTLHLTISEKNGQYDFKPELPATTDPWNMRSCLSRKRATPSPANSPHRSSP